MTKSILICALIITSATFANAQKTKRQRTITPQAQQQIAPEPKPVEVAPVPVPQANGSLFSAAAGTSLVTDFKPRGVGDLVFVDVVEASTATVNSAASRSRDSGTVGGLTSAIGSLPVAGAAATAAVVTAMGQRKFEGKGATNRNSRLNARIVARVVEVLPNGDLRIVAEKMVKINKEDEKLSLSGIVRTKDVSGDNSVPSTSIGDLKVALNGKGVASADNGPGWLFRILDKISPF
ncbi:MAG TPA: flagellar basal body L-ring protein FlgH [Pyrinomonadaceae bacterium]